MVDKPTDLLRSCPEEQSQPDTQRGLTAPVSLYLLEHTSSWASGASCSRDSDGEDGLLKLQENSAWVAPDSRERAELQKHHQRCGHHQVSGFSTSTQRCRRAAESRSTIHTGWVEESYRSRNDTKMLSRLDSGAERRGIHQPLCMHRGDRNITAAVPGPMDKDIPMRSRVKWLLSAAMQC